MASPLALSPDASIRTEYFGKERQPILVADQALGDAGIVREIAARHQYRPIGPFYPGLRAAVSAQVSMPLVEPLLGQLQTLFGLERELAYFECYLSLVTTQPQGLAPIQRLPHFDGVEPERIAVLLYLDPGEAGGTAFYRQRSTGFESVCADRFAEYERQLKAGIDESGLPEAAYISGDTALFERIHTVEGRFNRMVAYRGNTLHCAALAPDFIPDSSVLHGRLTLNLFLKA